MNIFWILSGFWGKTFFGVINPCELSEEEILQLKKAGIVGMRFNLKRMGMDLIKQLEKTAFKIWELARWHVELYVANSSLKDLFPLLSNLPKIVIDHLGLTKDGFDCLLKLVERGAKVKATGFGRLDFDPVWAMKEIVVVNENALMFGTDAPSTRAQKPFSWDDVRLIEDNFSLEQARKILCENALGFYKRS